MAIEPGKSELSAKELMELLPHRYPMLLIDKLVEIKPGDSAVAIKNVTMNEPFFTGHFPDQPVMPGVMIVEAMAQGAAAFTNYVEDLDTEGKVVLFMGIDKARFRRPILPGDQVRIRVRVAHRRPPVWRFEGEAHVDGNLVASATYTAMLASAEI
ncbi:MAG: 3-hydroxyacyl-ACP dehydratase FabZ [Pseudomonadota bacterium]